MSQSAVRSQIVTYLETNASTASGGDNTIPFLNSVMGFPPKVTPEGVIMGDDLPDLSGVSSGAVIFLYIHDSKDRQIEFRGNVNTGGKFVYYEVDLICVFFSEHAQSQDAGTDNESFTDGLKTAIRASKTCGTGTIFQWGQGDQTGATDIQLTSDIPQQIQGKFGKTMVQSLCKITVLEELT